MGFFDPKNVWGTGIEGVMGFPLLTNSGSTQNLWGMRDYGFRGLWDKRASTVFECIVYNTAVCKTIGRSRKARTGGG